MFLNNEQVASTIWLRNGISFLMFIFMKELFREMQNEEEEDEKLTKPSLHFPAGRSECYLKVKALLKIIIFLFFECGELSLIFFQKSYISVLWDKSQFLCAELIRVFDETYPNLNHGTLFSNLLLFGLLLISIVIFCS